MRLLSLHLQAFGPFTDFSLNFGQKENGLHIIYGANEAGKSAALRALHALFFGFPSQTSDNFLHPHAALRIGAVVQNLQGESLSFYRRKGNKDTLLDDDGKAMADTRLDNWLKGVSVDLFASLFGIDHQALLAGGKEILSQQGDLGQLLFSASLGTRSLHKVLMRLEEQANLLYKAKGKNPTINVAMRQFKLLKSQITDESLSSVDWAEKHEALEGCSQDLLSVQKALAKAKNEVHRLQRFQRLLPRLANRRKLLLQLESMSGVVELAEDFPQRRRQLETDWQMAEKGWQLATGRSRRIEDKLAEIKLENAILDSAEDIQELHAELGGFRNLQKKLPVLVQAQRELSSDLDKHLLQIRDDQSVDKINEFSNVLALEKRIKQLLKAYQTIRANRVQNERLLLAKTQRLKKVEQTHLEDAQDDKSQFLSQQIKKARSLGDIDSQIQTLADDSLDRTIQAKQLLASLTLWSGSLQDVLAVALPVRESIIRFQVHFDELASTDKRWAERNRESVDALEKVQADAAQIEYDRHLPTERHLFDTRAERDSTWGLIKKTWIDNETTIVDKLSSDSEKELAKVFEDNQRKADDISDQLRKDADKVSHLSQLNYQAGALSLTLKKFEDESEKLSQKRNTLQQEWVFLWSESGIEPLNPIEMLSWLEGFLNLKGLLENLQNMEFELRQKKLTRVASIEELAAFITDDSIGKSEEQSLGSTLVFAEIQLSRFEKFSRDVEIKQRESRNLLEELDQLKLDGQSLVLSEKKWQDKWQSATAGLALTDTDDPEDALGKIDEINKVVILQQQHDARGKEIVQLESEQNLFLLRLSSLEKIQFTESTNVEEKVSGLYHRLNEQLKLQSVYQEHKKELESVVNELDEHQRDREQASGLLENLLTEAKCKNTDQFETFERKSADLKKVKEQLITLESEILSDSEGDDINIVETQTHDIEKGKIVEEIESLDSQIKLELEPRQRELYELKGRLTKELELMDGSDKAAQLAEYAEEKLTGMRASVNDYIRLKVAVKLLRTEIEQFRQMNQGPLLQSASKYFSSLTLDAFTQLRAGYFEADEPVLQALRQNGEILFVEGMSTGTRDQLYLALRLAAVEKFVDENGPMPFVVDDVLIEFDDDRTQAALDTLAELSSKTQVVVFTHHQRLVEQAEGLGRGISIHPLLA